MKKLFWATLFIILTTGTVQTLYAQADGFGLGIVLGDPTGISFKKWAGDRGAIDGGVGWNLNADIFHVHVDYLVHFMNAIEVNQGQLPLYLGIGGSLNAGNNITHFGVRVPFGINYIFGDAPLDLFAEIAPGLQLIDQTDLLLEGGIGIRFWIR